MFHSDSCSFAKEAICFEFMKIKPIYLFLMLFVAHTAQTQTRLTFVADGEMMGQIDSNTLRIINKLFPASSQGDLNLYGFEEHDVPIYADSVYAYRLSILESEIPLEYNSYVRPYIDLYTQRRRKLAAKILSWSKYYFPQFEQALDRAGMPLEFKYLAVIESALNPMATSPVGAAGMWQFMAPTARIYGLKTGSYYDERRDVEKSTEAAIKYLQDSYRIYGDWLLVIASYNCGAGNVNKAIRKAGGVKNFWAIQRYLPAETRGYVPAFIAAAYFMNYASEHNIYPDETISADFHCDTIMVDNRYNLMALSDMLNMDLQELKSLNPALRRGVLPFSKDPLSIKLPYDKAQLFVQLQTNPEFKNQMDENLLALNKSDKTDKLHASVSGRSTHTVKRGENLASIARKNGMTLAELKKLNKLKSNQIKAGQKLRINRS